MAWITWDDVKARAPEVASAPDDMQTAILDSVFGQLCQNGEDNYGNWLTLNRRNNFAAYLCAHLAIIGMKGVNLPVGNLVREQQGPIERSFAPPPFSFSFEFDLAWDSTPYGRECKRLMRQLAPKALVL